MSKKVNFIIDAVIFVAFLLVYDPKLLGQTIHEWLSVAIAITILVHIVLHWDWIINVGTKYFKNLWQTSRLNFLVDLGIFIAFIVLMFSGIMISKSLVRTLGIELNSSMIWKMVHKTSAEISVLMVGLHFAMHWKWVLETLKQYIFAPVGRLLFRHKSQAASVAVESEDK